MRHAGGVYVTDLDKAGRILAGPETVTARALRLLSNCGPCPLSAQRAAALAEVAETLPGLTAHKRRRWRQVADGTCDVCKRALSDLDKKRRQAETVRASMTARPAGCPAGERCKTCPALETCGYCPAHTRAVLIADRRRAACGVKSCGGYCPTCTDAARQHYERADLAKRRAADPLRTRSRAEVADLVRRAKAGDCAACSEVYQVSLPGCKMCKADRAATAAEARRAGLDRRNTGTRRAALANGCGTCSKRGKGLKACRGCSVLEALETVTKYGTRRGGPVVQGGDGVRC
jgi:hypothetical protein